MKLFVLLAVLALLSANVLANEPVKMLSSLPPYTLPVFGSNQWYQAVLDGEGEASVAAKLTLQNLQAAITNVTLEIPGNARSIYVLQELPTKQQRCTNWQNYCAAYAPESVCTAWGPGGAGDC